MKKQITIILTILLTVILCSCSAVNSSSAETENITSEYCRIEENYKDAIADYCDDIEKIDEAYDTVIAHYYKHDNKMIRIVEINGFIDSVKYGAYDENTRKMIVTNSISTPYISDAVNYNKSAIPKTVYYRIDDNNYSIGNPYINRDSIILDLGLDAYKEYKQSLLFSPALHTYIPMDAIEFPIEYKNKKTPNTVKLIKCPAPEQFKETDIEIQW